MTRTQPSDAFAHYASLYLFLAVLSITSLLAAAARSQRERAEANVRDSERRYRTLVERMNEGVNLTDADARFTFVSDRFCEMVGYCARRAHRQHRADAGRAGAARGLVADAPRSRAGPLGLARADAAPQGRRAAARLDLAQAAVRRGGQLCRQPQRGARRHRAPPRRGPRARAPRPAGARVAGGVDGRDGQRHRARDQPAADRHRQLRVGGAAADGGGQARRGRGAGHAGAAGRRGRARRRGGAQDARLRPRRGRPDRSRRRSTSCSTTCCACAARRRASSTSTSSPRPRRTCRRCWPTASRCSRC